jgi:hypothetical protein
MRTGGEPWREKRQAPSRPVICRLR